MTASVRADQRYRRAFPCPICAGGYDLPQGKSMRCYGIESADGQYAHCSREEFAGLLLPNERDNTYHHRLIGVCKCGREHGAPAERVAVATRAKATAKVPKKPTVRSVLSDIPHQGETFTHVRHEAADGTKQGVSWRRNGQDGLDGYSPSDIPFYGSERLADLPDGTTVVITEGEPACHALRAHDIPAIACFGSDVLPSDTVLAPYLRFDLVTYEDHDADGERCMTNIAKSVLRLGGSIRRFRDLAARHKDDAVDYFKQGGDADILIRHFATAPPWESEPTPDDDPPPLRDPVAAMGPPVDLPSALAIIEIQQHEVERWRDAYHELSERYIEKSERLREREESDAIEAEIRRRPTKELRDSDKTILIQAARELHSQQRLDPEAEWLVFRLGYSASEAAIINADPVKLDQHQRRTGRQEWAEAYGLAGDTGYSRSTCSRVIDNGVTLGVFEKSDETFDERGYPILKLRPVQPTVTDTLHHIARVSVGEQQPRNQPRICPDHPTAHVLKRSTWSCAECGQVIGEPVVTVLPGVPLQDATGVREEDDTDSSLILSVASCNREHEPLLHRAIGPDSLPLFGHSYTDGPPPGVNA